MKKIFKFASSLLLFFLLLFGSIKTVSAEYPNCNASQVDLNANYQQQGRRVCNASFFTPGERVSGLPDCAAGENPCSGDTVACFNTRDKLIGCWPKEATTEAPVCKQGVFNYDPNDTTKRCCRVCTGGRGCGPCISEPSCSNANYKYSPASQKCENFTGGDYNIDPLIHCDPGADGVGAEGVQSAIGCIPTGDLPKFLAFILKFAFGAAGGIMLLMFIATGYSLITSTGNPEKLQAVKENLVSIFSGLIMIGFSLILLQTIGAGVLQLPGFTAP